TVRESDKRPCAIFPPERDGVAVCACARGGAADEPSVWYQRIRDPARSSHSYKPPEHRFAAFDSLAFHDFEAEALGQVGVGSRAKHDQTEAIAAAESVADFGVANDAPHYNSGDLH